TISRLQDRIGERFPERGISGVCQQLRELAPEVAQTATTLSRPNLLLRGAVGLVILAAIGLVFRLFRLLELDGIETGAFSFFQGLEALLNVVILSAAGIWFLLTLETRFKRSAALERLHELRSIAHVIDTHQLTKTPVAILEGGSKTASSPDRSLSPFELRRYLDYCSEMLSLTGKLAALYLAHSRDSVVIQAVNEVEELTSDLSRKIWQKISVMA
ncbi:MAG: hypothetical protein RLN72_04960, partial [Henriciella sp.]